MKENFINEKSLYILSIVIYKNPLAAQVPHGDFSNEQICQQAYQLVISYYRSSYSLFLQKTCYQES